MTLQSFDIGKCAAAFTRNARLTVAVSWCVPSCTPRTVGTQSDLHIQKPDAMNRRAIGSRTKMAHKIPIRMGREGTSLLHGDVV